MPGLSYFRKSLFLLLLWGVETGLVQAQELLWEKRIPLSNYEFLSCVTECSDGGYLAFGSSERWVKFNPWRIGAILMKFDQNGDTLWTKWTGKYGGFNKVIRGEDGLLYALMAYSELNSTNTVWSIYVVTEDGVPIVDIPLNPGPGTTLTDMELRNGSFWLSGERMPSIFHSSGLSFDFLLMKVRPDGSESFSFRFNGNDPSSRGRSIEFMPNGHILFSGSCGRNLSAFEIDTAGNQISFRNYFQNPLNGGWQNASVKQMADGSFMVGGYRSSTPVSYYIGKHDTSGAKIWGGIRPGAVFQSSGNTDSSTILIIQGVTDQIVRLKQDSSVIWAADFSNTPSGGTKQIWDVLYQPEQSAIIVGSNSNPGGSNANFYIARFGGFGIPFDPTSVKAPVLQKAEVHPVPFPNPGNDSRPLTFTQVEGPAQVRFFNLQGKTVLEGAYLPEKGLSTQSFSAGLYIYQLEYQGRLWVGKWMKE